MSSRDPRQNATLDWCHATIGDDVDLPTRCMRFLEEATELAQASGLDEEMAHRVVSYVFARPVGEPSQEVGGVMITLDLVAAVQGIDRDAAHQAEFERIHQPEVMEKVRRRQAEKRAAGL